MEFYLGKTKRIACKYKAEAGNKKRFLIKYKNFRSFFLQLLTYYIINNSK